MHSTGGKRRGIRLAGDSPTGVVKEHNADFLDFLDFLWCFGVICKMRYIACEIYGSHPETLERPLQWPRARRAALKIRLGEGTGTSIKRWQLPDIVYSDLQAFIESASKAPHVGPESAQSDPLSSARSRGRRRFSSLQVLRPWSKVLLSDVC